MKRRPLDRMSLTSLKSYATGAGLDPAIARFVSLLAKVAVEQYPAEQQGRKPRRRVRRTHAMR